MERKAIVHMDTFATPTVHVLMFVRKIQPKAMEMDPKEIAKLVNFVTPIVHVLIYAQKAECKAPVMEVKGIARLVNFVTQTGHVLLSVQKVQLMELQGMVQETVKEIVHLIKYATPVDVLKNAQNFQLVVRQEVEMEHKEIVKMVCFATLAWRVLPSVQKLLLVVMQSMVQETLKEIVNQMKYATQLDVQRNVQNCQLMVRQEMEMEHKETAKLVNFVTTTWRVPSNVQWLQLVVNLVMVPGRPKEIVLQMNFVLAMECV